MGPEQWCTLQWCMSVNVGWRTQERKCKTLIFNQISLHPSLVGVNVGQWRQERICKTLVFNQTSLHSSLVGAVGHKFGVEWKYDTQLLSREGHIRLSSSVNVCGSDLVGARPTSLVLSGDGSDLVGARLTSLVLFVATSRR